MPEREPSFEQLDTLLRETLRLNDRYVLEVVEAFGLCPWAKGARLAGHVARSVISSTQNAPETALSQLLDWASKPDVEIGLMIFPLLESDYGDFQRFVNELIARDARRYERTSSPFALAAFHPSANLDTTSADRLVPFLRRTPDPTIQVVRISALERVRGEENAGTRYVDIGTLRLDQLPRPEPTLRERIAAHNLATVERERADIVRVLDSIQTDRRNVRLRLSTPRPGNAS
jgi:hypothetical protein